MIKIAERIRFFSKIRRSPKCWLWTAGKFANGYGNFWQGRPRGAHRVAWEIAKGPIPKGFDVLHECDVRACVRPNHLFLGTKADNARDCASKGRHSAGERHGCAKLTAAQVAEIRKLYGKPPGRPTQAALAKTFGVSEEQIFRIISRRLWK